MISLLQILNPPPYKNEILEIEGEENETEGRGIEGVDS